MTKRIALAPILIVLCAAAGFGQDAAQGGFSRTLTVSGAAELDVSTGSGEIIIRQGASDRVEVTGRIRVHTNGRSLAEAQALLRRLEENPPVEQTGAMIRIGNIADRELQRNVSISYEIQTPAQTTVRSRTGSGDQIISGVGPVEANTGSGDLDLNSIRGAVRVQTGSGDIRVMSMDGTFHGRTGSGSVAVASSAVSDAEISTGSGDVRITGVKGSLRARTGSGGITADGEPGGAWDLQTGSGDVSVRLPQTARFDLNVHTGSGRLDVNHPLTLRGSIDRRRISGQVRGGGPLLAMRTGSGDIRID